MWFFVLNDQDQVDIPYLFIYEPIFRWGKNGGQTKAVAKDSNPGGCKEAAKDSLGGKAAPGKICGIFIAIRYLHRKKTEDKKKMEKF